MLDFSKRFFDKEAIGTGIIAIGARIFEISAILKIAESKVQKYGGQGTKKSKMHQSKVQNERARYKNERARYKIHQSKVQKFDFNRIGSDILN